MGIIVTPSSSSLNMGGTGIFNTPTTTRKPNIFGGPPIQGPPPVRTIGGTQAGMPGSNLSSPLQNQYGVYNAAVGTQAQDYDTLMNSYKKLFDTASSQPNLVAPTGGYQPAKVNYSPSSDVTSSLADLSGLAKTGGYSDADIADLRARGISPIRAVYANAQRQLDNQRRLQGGFSPNYGAVTAKMARDLSSELADQVTNVNAGIAQNVVQNKLTAAPSYASAAERENEARTGVDTGNANAVNEANRFNLELPLEYAQFNRGNQNNALAALEGMRSLYGTTPALSSLFGNQAMNTAGMQNQMNQQAFQNKLQQIAMMLGNF